MNSKQTLESLPMYASENGARSEAYDCGSGNFGYSIEQTTASEYAAYLAELAESGYRAYAENTIGACRFGTYLGGEGEQTVVHTMFYPNAGIAKVVCGERGFLPATEPETAERRVRPTLTQLGRLGTYQFNNGAPGMCYVIQLADGRYIVLDGGPNDRLVQPMKQIDGEWVEDGEPRMAEDTEMLYRFLAEHNPDKSEGAKPVVAAWFITHAHGDHTGLATDLWVAHKDDIVIENTVFNFPNHKVTEMRDGSSAGLDRIVEHLEGVLTECHPSAVRYVPHAGEKLHFPDCEIEFFYTHEDYYPNQLYSANDASLAFRVTMYGKTLMVMGDCDTRVSRWIAQNYGSALKSDMVQVTHHGANGGTVELYQNIDPEICFWPISDYQFATNPQQCGTANRYEFNAWLRENVKTHLVETETHVISFDEE